MVFGDMNSVYTGTEDYNNWIYSINETDIEKELKEPKHKQISKFSSGKTLQSPTSVVSNKGDAAKRKVVDVLPFTNTLHMHKKRNSELINQVQIKNLLNRKIVSGNC